MYIQCTCTSVLSTVQGSRQTFTFNAVQALIVTCRQIVSQHLDPGYTHTCTTQLLGSDAIYRVFIPSATAQFSYYGFRATEIQEVIALTYMNRELHVLHRYSRGTPCHPALPHVACQLPGHSFPSGEGT